ncbi:MAG: hypothetical protein LBV06_08870 [Propionibacteriaceae bacterium]|jgi:hypothetical protein|nr:hypothetical protein [Propionibacteriaceae bacterium]
MTSRSAIRPWTTPLAVASALLIVVLLGFGLVIDWGHVAGSGVELAHRRQDATMTALDEIRASSHVVGAFFGAMCTALLGLAITSQTRRLSRVGTGLIVVGVGLAGLAGGLGGLDGFALATPWNLRTLDGLAWMAVLVGAQLIAIRVIRRLGGMRWADDYLRAPSRKRQPR